MIRVRPQPEPPDFDAKIRRPGARFVAKFRETGKTSDLANLWSKCAEQLHELYDGLCAFSCMHIGQAVGTPSVEHFKPKSKFPDLAYEWSNYRLVAAIVNSFKGDSEDVLDPFEVENGWFALKLPACEVVPSTELSSARRGQVLASIAAVKLNHARLIADRRRYFELYVARAVGFAFLRFAFPFLALELERQGLRRAND